MNDQQRAAMTLALEALNEVETFTDVEADRVDEAITALREALSEQAEQEPLMDYERINALREGEQNGAEDAYFFVRPENDTPSLRKMFCQGFERGFHKGLKYAAPIRTKDLTDEEIDRALDAANVPELPAGYESIELEIARAVIAADRAKNLCERTK